jgi:hypothetical protein
VMAGFVPVITLLAAHFGQLMRGRAYPEKS